MAISQRWTVIGIFNEHDTAKKAMEELIQAEFTPEQIGYVMRDTGQVLSKAAVKEGEESGLFTGGILGGLMGAAETLLIPVLSPSVANTIPATVEPLAEHVVERFQHTGIDEQQDHILPVTDDGIPETSTATNIEVDNSLETQTIAQTPQTNEDDTLKMPAITQTSQTEEDDTLEMQEIAQISQMSETLDPAVQGEDEIVEPDEMQNNVEMPVDTTDTLDAADTTNIENNAGISRKLEDEVTGAITGGIVGGVVGVTASLLLPFIGPAIAGDAMIVALGGAALGAVAGGFLGTLVSIGVPEEHARQYEQEFKTGRTIVTVKTDDRQQDALNILQRNEAIYVNAHDRVL